ncbi:unnamed protein product [Heterobilharzia americana]|nr:unnamed protein product [Heterobilharzia americana]
MYKFCSIGSQKSGSESIHYARKFNDLTKRAISAYENFLNLNGISSNKTSLYFKESDIKPIVMACIYTARLYSQLISIDNMEKIQNLTKALNFYSQTVFARRNHIKHNSTTLIKSCEEIRIAKEMVSLLPIKLSRLSRGEIIPD